MSTKKKFDDVLRVAFVNLKGGVGKTALAVNFAAHCGRNGLKTLLVDVDPQTNATLCCISMKAWRKHASSRGTIADLLGLRKHATTIGAVKKSANVIAKNVFKNVDLIPSHLDLFTMDLDLASAPARERLLRKAIHDEVQNYDVVAFDCPPNLTIPTQNALAMSSHFVVPVSPDYLSALGVGILLNRIEEMRQALEIDLRLAGIVMSRVGRKATMREIVMTDIRKAFEKQVLVSQICERIAVVESGWQNLPIFECKDAKAAEEFTNVCAELLKRMGVK